MSTVSQRSKHLQHWRFLKWNDYSQIFAQGVTVAARYNALSCIGIFKQTDLSATTP
jgi:hypothetical protein